MATTLPIPLTTLPVGTRDLGPSHPADSEVSIVLTIDRTVAGGLNSLTPASAVALDVMQSNDGGATWELRIGSTFPGGLIPVGKTGSSNLLFNTATVDLGPGTSRQLKATVTVTGTPVAVAGTLVTT